MTKGKKYFNLTKGRIYRPESAKNLLKLTAFEGVFSPKKWRKIASLTTYLNTQLNIPHRPIDSIKINAIKLP
jgi:hypothetical protein